jgi:hypothetical protein
VRIAKLLTIHFLRRFFDHEMLGAGASPYASVVRTLSLLFLPGFLVAMYTYPLYVNIDFKWPHLLEPTRWSNKLLFCTIAASLMAFVTSLQWDALFPSRDDFMILTPLPLRRRMVFACKVAALGVFAAMFATAINIGPAIVFPSATVRPADPVWWVIGYAWTHGISLFLCSLFVFLFCLAVQGALLNLLPVRWYRRAAVVVQFLLMAASATLLLLFPLAAKLAPLGKPSPILQWFVPAWFAGLSEFWNGRQDPVFEMLAHNASLALQIAFFFGAAFYGAAYSRYLQKTIETSEDDGGSQSALSRWLARVCDRLLLPNQHERGVFHFIVQTLFRSPRHKLFLVGYAGVACALTIWELVTLFSLQSYEVLREPSPALLCIPLVISFFILSGIRFVFPRPAELKANWVFQLSEDPNGVRSLEAPVKVMVLLGVLPVTLPLLPVHIWLWGPQTAVLHLTYTALLGLLLVELMLLGFRKIPFACTFVPAGHNNTGWTMVYMIGFGVYAYAMASVEYWMLRESALRAPFLLGLLAVAWIGARRMRRALLAGEVRLDFDEAVEPAVRTLDLSQ